MAGVVQPPPSYRALLKALHWAVFTLAGLLLIAPQRPLDWALAVIVGIWALAACIFGIRARPGPAFEGWMRPAFAIAHIALLVLAALTALVVLVADGGDTERRLLIATFGFGMLHGVFHMWRHTVLRDGALRNITPKAMHTWL